MGPMKLSLALANDTTYATKFFVTIIPIIAVVAQSEECPELRSLKELQLSNVSSNPIHGIRWWYVIEIGEKLVSMKNPRSKKKLN